MDIDLEKFFDRVNHDKLMGNMGKRLEDKRLLRIIRAFLNAGVMENGLVSATTEGAPQGGPFSPLLINLFMHYAFDNWMQRHFPSIQFARYADDAVVHAKSLSQAQHVLKAIRNRLLSCGLELHPEKTRIVYCQDDDRSGKHEHIKFDFLGYTFRPRRAKNYRGKYFVSFLPLVPKRLMLSVPRFDRGVWERPATTKVLRILPALLIRMYVVG